MHFQITHSLTSSPFLNVLFVWFHFRNVCWNDSKRTWAVWLQEYRLRFDLQANAGPLLVSLEYLQSGEVWEMVEGCLLFQSCRWSGESAFHPFLLGRKSVRASEQVAAETTKWFPQPEALLILKLCPVLLWITPGYMRLTPQANQMQASPTPHSHPQPCAL